MSIQKFDKNMNIVAALDDEPNDVGGLTSAELKAKFDEGGNLIQAYINTVLLPALESLGVETTVQLPTSAGMKYIRLNADKVLEVSSDGKTWQATGSSGHVIVAPDGTMLPQRSRMKFTNGTVTDDGTQTVITGVKGDKGDKGDTVNPNLLDNWYFGNPVNQRGEKVYFGSGYGIDRWKATNSNTTVGISYGCINLSGDAVPYIINTLEFPSLLLGKVVTLSVLLDDGTLKSSKSTLPSSLPSENTLYCNITDVADLLGTSAYLSVRLKAQSGGSNNIVAVKLELGNQQTLAHQDENGVWVLNEIPDYGEQLARCQRYFQTFATESLRPTNALDFRPVMRATPELSTITVGEKTLYTASADL